MMFGYKCARCEPLKLAVWFAAFLGCLLVRSGAAENNSSWYQDLCRYKWEAIDQDNKLRYTLKLCESSPSTSCGPDTAMCLSNLATNKSQSVGDLSLQKLSGTVLDFNSTRKCPGSSNKIQTSISFQCGKTMGTPEFVTVSQCVHYFEWKTYVACKKDKFKPHKEVPCYVFDSDGKKHDLSPLIKLNGGYLVEDRDDSNDSFYINICRSLNLPNKPCTEGSAACLVTRDGSYNMGFPTQQLELVTSDSLMLRYLSDNSPPPEICGLSKPAVNITFRCPSSRNLGSIPQILTKSNCRYEVEWATEYACHRDYLESHTCKLTSEQHDISIDLTPLTLASSDHSYYTQSGPNSNTDSYIYYLNVCGKVPTTECGDGPFISSCQVKNGEHRKMVAGRYENQTLRYSDGDLTLIYPNGHKCSSGFERMTIINFKCDKNAPNGGRGNPEFAGETDCTYYFNWDTAFACVKEKEDLLCQVTDDHKHYDLSLLTRYPELEGSENWEVLVAKSSKSNLRYYLNVCHKVIPRGGAAGCPVDASICAVDGNKYISLGSFLSSPQKTEIGNDIRLVYTDGSFCTQNKTRIQTILTLKCKPGHHSSVPVLLSVTSDECFYELEWHTAAACVLSKKQGDNCKVEDPEAGFSFDLSPLTKPNGGFYNLTNGGYKYYINVCGAVSVSSCPEKAGACQVEKNSWSLGEENSRLSYYDGLIQLTYSNGTKYNNKEQTPRSTVISFLCDPQIGVGEPEFQVEDKYTYNFHWYTSYVCPERPHGCLVTDPDTGEQYDLSSLSRTTSNWHVMDLSDSSNRKKYYINICRPINPVHGCDRKASICEIKYVNKQGSVEEVVSVSNMGISKRGPIIEERDHLMLEFTDGSACSSDGQKLTYTTRIHLVCSNGNLLMQPRFLMYQNCTATFMWETRAACAITSTINNTCSVVDPETGFEYNLMPLASKTSYNTSGNGKTFLVNICSDVAECGPGVSGCEMEGSNPVSFVGEEKTLEFSANDILQLTYKGSLDVKTGTRDTFQITFVCDPKSYPGFLKLVKEEMSTSPNHTVHDVLFKFPTALACTPAPVDCRITDLDGTEYDLSRLIRNEDDSPWIPINIDSDTPKKFYINVCKPLPRVKECPGGLLGSCGVIDGKSYNLGYMQSSPQVTEDGSISVVYHNGHRCGSWSRYSTRIIFQCDENLGSPMFDRLDHCEYVFIWRTSEACPIRKSQGDDCRVRDPKSGYEFNLSSLKGRDYSLKANEYTYHLSICGGLPTDVCNKTKTEGQSVSSCQVAGSKHKVAGRANQVLTYVGDQIILNYTNGDICHKVYERSTEIYFSCNPDRNPGEPEYIRETPDCTYLFNWPTALACVPVMTTSCSYNDDEGNSYDLSPLAMDSQNWEVELPTEDPNKQYYINVCRSLVKQKGPWNCPSTAASCLKDGDKYLSLGEVHSGPTWEGNVLKLQYTSGQACPDGSRNRTSIIRFKCDKEEVNSRPSLISGIEDCVYTFLWVTAAACPLKSIQHDDCRVTNPATGHLFDLNTLTKENGYIVHHHKDQNMTFSMNICGSVPRAGCSSDTAVCINKGDTVVSGGKVSKKLVYKDQVLELTYEGGSPCPANANLTHSTVIHFICSRPADMSSAPSEPVLIDLIAETCTYIFDFHTPLVCEQSVTCSVQNGSALIDLTPLIRLKGYYTATDDDIDPDNSPDFYVNICQPLNSIPGVACPPGAAVCMVPDGKQPVEIGRTTRGPELNKLTGKVSITYSSSTKCASDSAQNYASTILFTCNRGLDMGSPQMLRLQGCVYFFEWATPIVCPDTSEISGCQLTDAQLEFTFDLTKLTGEVQVKGNSGTYLINVCNSVAEPACKRSAVCHVSGSGSHMLASSFGTSKAMKMFFEHKQQAVLMQYDGGDPCQAVPAKRQSSIFFKCDHSAGRGSPTLISETAGCSVSFDWRTNAVCPPRKMECKLVSQHKTFNLQPLSSLSKPWTFNYKGDLYFMNVCQGIHGGLTDCPEDAAMCRRTAAGKTEVLGRVYTQKMELNGEKIFVNYSLGDDLCPGGLKAKTVIQLSCGSTVGHPTVIRVDEVSCEFLIGWRAVEACAVKPREVQMVNGTIKLPKTGVNLSLGALYFSPHQVFGDIRTNGDRYTYYIQLSGITNRSLPNCVGANICQVKLKDKYRRKIGFSNNAKYYIEGEQLDVILSSQSECGRKKNTNVSSTIKFRCNPSAGVGIPEFMHETDDCQYLFVWYTNALCYLKTVDNEINDDSGKTPSSRRSQAMGVVLSLLLVVLVVCLMGLLLHKRERRELVRQKIAFCCRRGSQVSYKYSKVSTDEEGGEEEMEWLMEEMDAPPTSSSSLHRGRSNQSNGHIKTKPVNTEGLRSFTLDEQDDDSEDEVLSVPGVRVKDSRAPRSAFLQEESDEDLVGLLDESDRKRKSSKPRSSGLNHDNNTAANRKREEDDSDEDLLRV